MLTEIICTKDLKYLCIQANEDYKKSPECLRPINKMCLHVFSLRSQTVDRCGILIHRVRDMLICKQPIAYLKNKPMEEKQQPHSQPGEHEVLLSWTWFCLAESRVLKLARYII